jgi:ApaG protein
MKALFPHERTTRGITVRVAVNYMAEQSLPAQGRWFWAYHIRIENGGPLAVQLLTRHWLITDGRGGQDRVEGDGVVGEQPVIEPGESYDYVSGCPLATAAGAMEGYYGMIDARGDAFQVMIPRFALLAPATAR